MPRPRRNRRIWSEPGVTYFKPAGIRMRELDESIVTVDEFEAVRLKDLEGLEQGEAAKKMGISQPTFHRLLLTARKKVADALTNGKAIRIEGGNYTMMRRSGKGMAVMGRPATTCKCPACEYSEQKARGVPCSTRKCPKCGSSMIRGD
jgi:predicted DNA-binding protein (UPF0251 family)